MSVKDAYKMCYRLERLSRTGRVDADTANKLQGHYPSIAWRGAIRSASTRFQPFGGWRNLSRSAKFGYLKWAIFADSTLLPEVPF